MPFSVHIAESFQSGKLAASVHEVLADRLSGDAKPRYRDDELLQKRCGREHTRREARREGWWLVSVGYDGRIV